MLRFFRAFATSTAGPIILGLIMFAFLILGPAGGVRDVLRGHLENAVVQAGSHTVSRQDFERIFNQRKRDYEQRAQQAFPLEDAIKAGVDRQLVDGLAEDKAYAEMLSRAGVRPSDEVVATELKRAAESGRGGALAQMFNSVTGKFDQGQLGQFLRQNNLTLDEFQSELRDNIADQEFGSAVANGFRTPSIYAAAVATLLLENRDVTYFVVPLAAIAPPSPPTDAQLNALIQKSQVVLPEMRRITIVRFSAKAIAPSMTVDPAAVQQEFNSKQAAYGRPELRSLVEIPLNDPGQAASVQARLQHGEDPVVVARSIGTAAISYSDQPQYAVTDVKAAATAFAMKEGEVSGPVLGDFKTVILKVTKITPGQAPTLEAARPQIEADLRQQAAIEKVYDLTQKFENAHDAGANMAAAAAQAGVAAVSVGPITADGKDLTSGQQNPVLTEKLLKTAFSLSQGGDSDVEQDADKGEYYVVHVDQVVPPHAPKLDEPGVRQQVTQAYLSQTVTEALQAKADAAKAAIDKGGTFEAAAAANGAQVVHQINLQRIAAQQYQQTLGQQFMSATFSAKPHDVFTAASDPLRGVVVARIDAARPADPAAIAVLIPQVRQRTDQAYLGSLAGAVRTAAVKAIKPTTDLDLADAAMGVDEATIARLRQKPAAGAGAPAKPSGLAQ